MTRDTHHSRLSSPVSIVRIQCCSRFLCMNVEVQAPTPLITFILVLSLAYRLEFQVCLFGVDYPQVGNMTVPNMHAK